MEVSAVHRDFAHSGGSLFGMVVFRKLLDSALSGRQGAHSGGHDSNIVAFYFVLFDVVCRHETI